MNNFAPEMPYRCCWLHFHIKMEQQTIAKATTRTVPTPITTSSLFLLNASFSGMPFNCRVLLEDWAKNTNIVFIIIRKLQKSKVTITEDTIKLRLKDKNKWTAKEAKKKTEKIRNKRPQNIMGKKISQNLDKKGPYTVVNSYVIKHMHWL